VDTISILGVEPGIGGQMFNPKVLAKIERTAEFRTRHGLATRIAVDGGVHPGNLRDLVNAGIDTAILGSGIFSGPIEENVRKLGSVLFS
jgi:ribulose-phosphate 3-epimerase